MRRIGRCLAVLALTMPFGVPLLGQTAGMPAFTVERLLELRRVSDPQLSPDGSRIAYVVTEVNLAKNSRNNDIWVVPVAGGRPVAVARGDRSEDTPRWSPDGTRLAFVSNDDGESQVRVIQMGPAGPVGESRKLTSLETEASAPIWSPDGKWVVFVSDVFPECTTVQCNELRLKELDDRKSKARVFDRLLFRHWTSWKGGRYSHLHLVPVDRSAPPRDLTPGDADVPPFSLGGPIDYAFSPDSRELAFARKTDPIEAISTNSDLFLLDLTTPAARPRKITTNTAADGGPAYSPDGRFIAYRAQHRAGFEADRWQLMLYDRGTGAHRSITADWDRSADGYVWTPDSRAIYITHEEQGAVSISRLDLSGGLPKRLPIDGSSGDLSITPDGRTLVFSHSRAHQAVEIYRAAADGSGLQAITDTNPGLAAFQLRPAESVWYEGVGGTKVQAWIVKPAGFVEGRKYPLLFIVHGGPQNAFNDSWGYRWNAQVFASAGYVVMLSNPRGSTGFGQQFTDEISRDWGGKVYDDLMKGLDFAEALPYVQKGRVGTAGASYGGYMMNWFLGHTDRFRAIVSHASVYNLTSMYGATEELWFPEWEFGGMPWTAPEAYAKWSPHTYAKDFKTPTLVTHGELDFRVPIGEGLQLFTTLQRQGVPSRMVYFPDEGHWINKPANAALWYHEFLAWMDRWVKP